MGVEQGHSDANGGERSTDFSALFIEQHPEAVVDVKKAEVMARAGNPSETDAAKAAEYARKNAMSAGYNGQISPNRKAAEDAINRRKQYLDNADKAEKFAGEIYDKSKER